LNLKHRITFLEDARDLRHSLLAFSEFYNGNANVWCHTTFDIPILVNAYKVCSLSLPFDYKKSRDIRTLVALSGITVDTKQQGKTHNALDDCLFQIRYCMDCFRAIAVGR